MFKKFFTITLNDAFGINDLSNKGSMDEYKIKQCVHDIRSPLALLDHIIKDNLDKISEKERTMLRSALTRISHVANTALNI